MSASDDETQAGLGRVSSHSGLIVGLAGAFLVVALSFGLSLSGYRSHDFTPGGEGQPGGYGYRFGIGAAFLLSAAAITSPLGTLARRWVAGRDTVRGSWQSAAADSLGALPSSSPAWPWMLLGWLVLCDALGIVEPHVVPPLGRVAQVIAAELTSGRLVVASAVTMTRTTSALLIALLLALALVMGLGESPRARSALVPWLRWLATIPPVLFFTFAPYFGRSDPQKALLASLRPDAVTDSFLSETLGKPHLILILAWVAFWPLVAFGLGRYAETSEGVCDEAQSLRLPWWKAALGVKLPLTLRSIIPAFHIATILAFVLSFQIESVGSTNNATSGVGAFYLKSFLDNDVRDVWMASIIMTMSGALAVIAVADFAAALYAGQRNYPSLEQL